MLKAFIFDMDGVLIDSPKIIQKTFAEILKEDGVDFNEENIGRYLGHSIKDMLKIWEKDYGIKGYNIQEFSRRCGKKELEILKKDVKPDERVIKFLKDAKFKGIKLAVATSSLKWRAIEILNFLNIKDMFDAIVSAEDVEKHKPEPDVFLEAAKRLNENPQNCIVFEDAKNGVEAARRSNMKVIAIKNGICSEEDLKDADMIINNFSEINLEKLYSLF